MTRHELTNKTATITRDVGARNIPVASHHQHHPLLVVVLCIRPLFIYPPPPLSRTPKFHPIPPRNSPRSDPIATMKFGKSLNNQIVETLPDWRDKFLSYKDLKKRLKQIGAGSGERRSKRQRVGDGRGGSSPPAMTPEEAGFVALLDAELDKFNAFFLEKEEDYVIRLKVID